MSEPTSAQMNCGRCLYGPPAICTCGTCPKLYFDRWMPGDGWPEEWEADGPSENIHILLADRPHMRVCFMTSDGPTEERAALIAQAPSLRAALKEMVNAWEPDEGGSMQRLAAESANEIERLRDANANLGNAAAIVYAAFKPSSGSEETDKALLKMELGIKD
jgi:hypothetical protein